MRLLRQKRELARAVVAILAVPFLSLLAADRWLAGYKDDLPSWLFVWGGTIFAIAVLTLVCSGIQRCTCLARRVQWLPITYAGILVLGPVAWKDASQFFEEQKALAIGEATPSAVDILLVEPAGAAFHAVRPAPDLRETPMDAQGWDVQFSVASPAGKVAHSLKLHVEAKGRRAALHALTGALGQRARRGRPLTGSLLTWSKWRQDAIQAVVLNVDGIQAGVPRRATEPAEWEGLSGNSTLGPPVHVILASASNERLRKWKRWAARRGGDAVRFTELGRPLLLDAALRIATESSADFPHQTLARRYRPTLLFDLQEQLARPLDIEGFLDSGKVKACGEIGGSEVCRRPTYGSALDSPTSYLSFDPDVFRGKNEASAIYYHVARNAKEPDHLYLDYWWYFPYNPTAIAQDLLCNPGFNAASVTCFDHVSDWEGITVVLKEDGRNYVPEAAIYGQHEFGVWYDWHDLQSEWAQDPRREGDRPLVFVATDSHASYPTSCESDCDQVTSGLSGWFRKDGDHDGGQPWSKNADGACMRVCLKRLPQTRDGKPALWNASPRIWGERFCAGGSSLCDGGLAPRAPRFQGRFSEPWKPASGTKVEFPPFETVRFSTYD